MTRASPARGNHAGAGCPPEDPAYWLMLIRVPARAPLLGALTLAAACRPAAGRPSPAPEPLRTRIEARVARVPGAVVGVAYRDLATGEALDVMGDTVFHAASTMKVPVLVELFRQADAGALSLDATVPLANEFRSIVDGSPYALSMADDSDSTLYGKVGTRVPIRELAELMIVRSSNLATNALIALVGAERADETARRLGARHTQVLRGVEDGKAYERGLNNRTTANDLAAMMAAIERGEAVSAAGARTMREILMRQEFNGEIPAGLPPGTRVAHKTGQITAHLHDAAIVYPPGRAPYVLAVMTRGIPDERAARALIADVSRAVWEHATARGTARGTAAH